MLLEPWKRYDETWKPSAADSNSIAPHTLDRLEHLVSDDYVTGGNAKKPLKDLQEIYQELSKSPTSVQQEEVVPYHGQEERQDHATEMKLNEAQKKILLEEQDKRIQKLEETIEELLKEQVEMKKLQPDFNRLNKKKMEEEAKKRMEEKDMMILKLLEENQQLKQIVKNSQGVVEESRKEDVITRTTYCQENTAAEDSESCPVTRHPPSGAEGKQRAYVKREILGIRNARNLCYMISLLQGLAAVRAHYTRDVTHKNYLWMRMVWVMSRLCTVVPTTGALEMTDSLETIKNHFPVFDNDKQQDSFEFFTAVMHYGGCQSCVGNCVLLDRLFGVELANYFQCVCQKTWMAGHVKQHFLDLDLPECDEPTTVQALVDNVFSTGHCERECSGCGEQKNDIKNRQTLISSSSVMVMRVKRWASNGTGLKNTRSIKFHLGDMLTVTPNEGAPLTYKLMAAVIHHGDTIASGHYTATVLVDGETYTANDDRTQPVTTLEESHYKQCYMFFLNQVVSTDS
ncbi:ubiquitin carboxyl-terminal hydrolase 36-like [Branchiostoma floridae x Branchiostoma japonicum]